MIKLHHKHTIVREENYMKRFAQIAFLKVLVITIVFDLVCMIYGLISNNPYRISLLGGVIFFAALFFIELIGYLWKNRKR